MDCKKKIFKIIDICFIIGLFIYISIIAISILKTDDSFFSIEMIGQNISQINKKEMILVIIFCYLTATLKVLFNPFGITILMYIVYRIINRYMKRKNRKHPKFDIEYFRDDLDKISPAYISYLINFELDIDTDVPAHILKLELDGYIEEENNRLVVTNKDQSTLASSDLIILDIVRNNFKNLHTLNQYKMAVENEMQDAGYIKTRISTNKIVTIFSGACIFYILSFFMNATVMMGSMSEVKLMIIFIFTILRIFLDFALFIFLFVYPFVYAKKGTIKRTDKGNELLEKIYGLKNFLSDFTNLEDSKLQEVKIREHYLVYALVLDINDVAEDEMLKRIKRQMNEDHSYL